MFFLLLLYFQTKGVSSPVLQKVDVKVEANEMCREKLKSVFKFGGSDVQDKWQVCAGGLGKDSCSGDSGGPLLARNILGDIVQVLYFLRLLLISISCMYVFT